MGRLRWDSSKARPAATNAGTQGSGTQGSETRVVVDVGRKLGLRGGLIRLVALIVAIAAIVVTLSAVHFLPQLRNPFAETTTDRSQAVLLKSITELHRYEAASGEFQVVVDVTSSSFLPSFLQGSETVFIGVGTDNSYVDFTTLGSKAVTVSADRLSATIKLPHAQLETANLDVDKSYVFGTQQGIIDKFSGFFGGDPNNQQKVYILARDKITAAAKQSELIADAERNTTSMLTGLLHSLGFTTVSVTYS